MKNQYSAIKRGDIGLLLFKLASNVYMMDRVKRQMPLQGCKSTVPFTAVHLQSCQCMAQILLIKVAH